MYARRRWQVGVGHEDTRIELAKISQAHDYAQTKMNRKKKLPMSPFEIDGDDKETPRQQNSQQYRQACIAHFKA